MKLIKDTKVMLKVDLFAGSDIADIAKILCRLATALDVIATAQFNEVTLYAKPNADPDEMVKGYEGARASTHTHKMVWAYTRPDLPQGLKPCPFCGNPTPGFEQEGFGTIVRCGECMARSGAYRSSLGTAAHDATQGWNRRP